MMYSKYLVKDTDQFDPAHFPAIIEDLDVILASMAQSPDAPDSALLVSFVRHQGMEPDGAKANPGLAEMIRSQSLPVANLEALFASCAKNPSFRKQLEEYVLSRFNASNGSSVF
jgi:hypothetical protein